MKNFFGHVILHDNWPLCRDFRPTIHNLCCEIEKIVTHLVGVQITSNKGNFSKILGLSESAWKSSRRFWNSTLIRPIFLVKNACWSSAFWKIRDHNIYLNCEYKFWNQNITHFHHAFSTRIMGLIWMNSRAYGYFFTLIPMHLKFLENSPYLRYFVHLQDWWQFCRFHSTGFVLGTENFCIGVNFYAESHDQKRFSKFENFTLSWS